MYGHDPDDFWERLVKALREERQRQLQDILTGRLLPPEYAAACARVAQIDETIDLQRKIRRGEDREPIEADRLPSPDE